ncbi:PTS fructose transporter subunit IIA [Enterococcus faecalis]|nr:PTS fructose transporter subunit IIA [Enterococcus faecalis]
MEWLLLKKIIFFKSTVTNARGCFSLFSKKSTELEVAQDAQEVFDKLNEREQEGTTGMMNGFAIPHAKAATIQQAAIIIVTLDQGVEWQSLDNQLTEFVIALFIPDAEAGTTHLKLLSSVARLLLREEVTSGLKQASSPAEIATLLNNQLGEGTE